MAFSILSTESKPPRRWQNQRATVRYKCAPATPGKVQLDGDMEFHRAWVVDLSRAGIGIIMSRAIECGAHVTIQLKSADLTKAVELAAHIMHVTMQSDGDWVIGCEFVSHLTADQLEDLL